MRDCRLAARVAMPAGAGTWLPGELSWLRGCRDAAGMSQCAPRPPVHRDVQQHIWADFASIRRQMMGASAPLSEVLSK